MQSKIWINPSIEDKALFEKECADIQTIKARALFIYKDDRSSCVYKVKVGGVPVVVKHLKTKSAWQAFRRYWQISRAWKNRVYSNKCAQVDIPCFSVLATIERRRFGAAYDSYIVMSCLEGISLLDIFGLKAQQKRLIPTAAKQMASLLENLSQAGLSHRDMNFSNLLLTPKGVAPLDLDGMRTQKWWHRWFLKSDKQRFIENWLEKEYAAPEALSVCQAEIG